MDDLFNDLNRPTFEEGPAILVRLSTKERFFWYHRLDELKANSHLKKLYLREEYSYNGGKLYPVKRPNGKVIREFQVYNAKGVIRYLFANPFYYENALNRINFETIAFQILEGISWCLAFADLACKFPYTVTVTLARLDGFRWVMPGDSAVFTPERLRKASKSFITLSDITLENYTESNLSTETPLVKVMLDELQNYLQLV